MKGHLFSFIWENKQANKWKSPRYLKQSWTLEENICRSHYFWVQVVVTRYSSKRSIAMTKHKHTHQWDQIKDTHIIAHTFRYLIFYLKRKPKIYILKNIVSSTIGTVPTGYSHWEDRYILITMHKTQLKMKKKTT